MAIRPFTSFTLTRAIFRVPLEVQSRHPWEHLSHPSPVNDHRRLPLRTIRSKGIHRSGAATCPMPSSPKRTKRTVFDRVGPLLRWFSHRGGPGTGGPQLVRHPPAASEGQGQLHGVAQRGELREGDGLVEARPGPIPLASACAANSNHTLLCFDSVGQCLVLGKLRHISGHLIPGDSKSSRGPTEEPTGAQMRKYKP